MQSERYLNVRSGNLMVVADLHGDGDAFDRYVETFLAMRDAGDADRLVILGDLIHGYGDEESDHSIRMILRVIELQERFGKDVIIMLLGNHEMPHIYSVSLAKGELEFTPRFERSMGEHREQIVSFLKTLPFAIRTANGVLLTHAGPDESSINRIERLRHFNHDDLINEANQTLAQQDDLEKVYETYATLTGHSYQELALSYLGVEGPEDPRYPHLMRALFISERDHRFAVLWDFLFTQNERGLVPDTYEQICRRYLDAFTMGGPGPQRVCVSGHIVVPSGGFVAVNARHFRIASAAHARPRELGVYLMLENGISIEQASDLEPLVRSVF
jgi:hypothetical protein